jgi:MSHA pilin protein MshA
MGVDSVKTNIRKLPHKGFTLIELIITIVIIGVLAAVAIPKFLNLSNDAEKGVAAGVGAALASATTVNYGRKNVPGAVGCTAVGTPAGCTYWPLANCTDLVNPALGALADVPLNYVVSGGALNTTGVSVTCTVTSPNGATATFSAYGS